MLAHKECGRAGKQLRFTAKSAPVEALTGLFNLGELCENKIPEEA